MNDTDITTWMFNFISPAEDINYKGSSTERLFHYFFSIICLNLDTKTKFSLVTSSKSLFEETKSISPKLLPIYISVILISEEEMNVLDEYYLDTKINISDDTKKKFSLI